MRRVILSAVPLIAGALAGCSAEPVRRGGIVSTNPCGDALLVGLAPERLAAISHYSKDPAASSIPAAVAARYAATTGTAEEVIARRPELVVSDTFAPAATRAAYARAGLRVLTLDSPASVAASEAQVRAVAAAVGEPARGEALVADIERALPDRLSPARPSALLYIAGDLANGAGTLLDDLLRRSGFRNAAADYGLAFTGTLPIETIAAHPPAVILSAGDGRTADLRRRVLARSGAATREAGFDHALMNCGGPTIVAASRRLGAIRAGLVR